VDRFNITFREGCLIVDNDRRRFQSSENLVKIDQRQMYAHIAAIRKMEEGKKEKARRPFLA
jgi:hypothetical protein